MLKHDLPRVDNESKVKLARTVVVREVREAVDLARRGRPPGGGLGT